MAARHYRFGTSGNPLVQALWAVLGLALLVGALVMGAVVLSLLFALGAIAVGVIAIRVWWLRRKLARAGAFDETGSTIDAADRASPRLIEAEYTVVAERDARAGDEARAPDTDEARRRSGRRASR